MKKCCLLLIAFFVLIVTSCQQPPEGEWISIFNGTDIKEWKETGNSGVFAVSGQELVAQGLNTCLYYNGVGAGSVENFELELEIKTEPGANAALFFHTEKSQGIPEKGYRIEINNTTDRNINPGLLKTGSLSGIRNIYFPFVEDNEWFNMKVVVVENHVEVYLNQVKVLDYIQPEEPWRADGKEGTILDKGTIALYSGDNNETVSFRNIQLKRLAEGTPVDLQTDNEWDTLVTKLMDKGFPLIDFHVHIKGTLTIEETINNSQRLGINYGIAPNCGLTFPVTNDSTLNDYLAGMENIACFKGMQAEGREWVTMFSEEAASQFDYIFTDAMTFTDKEGNRTRIWMSNEVFIDDAEEFVETIVAKIEAIMSQEPVDIYVNPTVLASRFEDQYDELWTQERKERVIKVLAENNIALEINARYKTPKADMIMMAKEAGIKFSLGTNNTGNDLGQLEYCLEMIEECGLTPDDMFMPKLDKDKPINTKGLPDEITG